MSNKRTKIALIGEAVSKSPSPDMHNSAFKHLGLPYTYEAISISPDRFVPLFDKLKTEYLGLNITIPYKEMVVAHLEHLSLQAAKLGAVNTVIFSDQSQGDNTDAYGCMKAMQQSERKSWTETGALILGTGGAARATIEALVSLGVRQFAVANRSPERLRRFQSWFVETYVSGETLESFTFDQLNQDLWERHSIFVNAAPLEACSAINQWADIRFNPNMFLVEWVYRPRRTPWIEKIQQGKGTFVEGYKILLHQGMKAFELWTNVEAPEQIMAKTLLDHLS